MAGILKTDFSMVNAEHFMNAVININSNIYIALAKSTDWPNESLPPVPSDKMNDETSFRTGIIGIKKILASNATIVVPRINWTTGTTYAPLSVSIDAAQRQTNWYIRTSLNYVYQCITAGAGASTVEPSTKGSSVTTADGYTWKFLYEIPTSMITGSMLLDDWMPVPYNTRGVYPGGSLTADMNTYGTTSSNRIFGAYRVLVSMKFENEVPAIPYDISFRQIGILYDPKDSGGSYISGDKYPAANFNTNSGELIYLENKRRVYRESGQSETVSMILVF